MKMRFDPRWIVLDLTGPQDADLMVHSVAGTPCQRSLRRAAKAGQLTLDREAILQLTSYVRSLDLSRPEQSVHLNGRHIAHHIVEHPSHGALSVAVWMHEDEPTERCVLNAWVLDLHELTTVTAGDDVSLMADGREEGETRPIQDLWRFLNPADAAQLVIRYHEALVEDDGTWFGFEWTLNLPDSDPLHLFSGGRLHLDGERRSIVGTTVVLEERTKQSEDLFGPLVNFAGVTLAVINRDAQSAVTSIGPDAPLSYEALRVLVTKHDLHAGDFTTCLDGKDFDARVIPIAGPDSGAATVLLRRRDGE